MNNLRNYLLERRLRKLERYVYERTIVKGDKESLAFKVWKWLIDNGPSTRDQVRAAFNTAALKFLGEGAKEGAIIKNGHLYSANPDYSWEDVGKVNYGGPSVDSIRAALDDMPDDMLDELNNQEEDLSDVNADIFSDDIREVKAAIKDGVSVESENDDHQTPLYAATLKKNNSDIVKVLLDAGADPNAVPWRRDPEPIFNAIKLKQYKTMELLINAGADLDVKLKDKFSPVAYAAHTRMNNDNILMLINDKLITSSSDSHNYRIYGDLQDEFLLNKLNEKTYIALLKVYFNIMYKHYKADAYNFMTVHKDLDKGVTSMLDHATAHKVYHELGFDRSWPKNSLLALYNADVSAHKNGLPITNKTGYASRMLELSKLLNIPVEGFVYDYITVDYIREAYHEDLDHLVSIAIDTGNTEIMQKIVRSRAKLNAWPIVYSILHSPVDSKTTRAACRMLDNAVNLPDNAKYVAQCNNMILIEYYIDAGYDQDLLKYKDIMSKECKQALEEAGATEVADIKNHDMIYRLKTAVKEDVFREADRILKKNPELLEEPEIVEFIRKPENDHSYTARELRKRLPEGTDTYDF